MVNDLGLVQTFVRSSASQDRNMRQRCHAALLYRVLDDGREILLPPRTEKLVNALDDVLFHGAEGPDFGNAVPGVGMAWLPPNGLIALEESRHKELFGEGGEF